MDLEPHEIRVLGCLLEKQRTTPDAYPLSLNALRLACNQSTNRDPVLDLDEATVRDALTRLARRRFTRLTSSTGSRSPKFRHLLDESLPMPEPSRAVLAVLMLRGPQTPGELKQRTERLHPMGSLEAVGEALGDLLERALVQRLERRPGQKEERYQHRLGEEAAERPTIAPAGEAPVGSDAQVDDSPAAAAAMHPAPAPAFAPTSASVPTPEPRMDAMERELASLRSEVAELREVIEDLHSALS